jgi:serine/threonine protein phosphatase PrpC
MAACFTAAGFTDQGRSRPRNEDAFLTDPELGLAVVADGIGGHRAGHIASAMATAEVRLQLTTQKPLPSSRTARVGSPSPLGKRMADAVRSADALVRADASSAPERMGMGTTLTALVVRSEELRMIIGHVGDSRAYLFEKERLRQLTRDHTWVQEQVDRGALSVEKAADHPWGHIITQGVGVGDDINPELLEQDANPGQLYLLCTDGLTNMLPDTAMERIITEALPGGLDPTARALVAEANERGGLDNITAVLVSIDEE